jgi:hypothetical protein
LAKNNPHEAEPVKQDWGLSELMPLTAQILSSVAGFTAAGQNASTADALVDYPQKLRGSIFSAF